MTEEKTPSETEGGAPGPPETETTEEVEDKTDAPAPEEEKKPDKAAPKETFQLSRVITLLGFFAAITALAMGMNVFLDLDERLENIDTRSGVAISNMEQKVNAIYASMSEARQNEREPRDEKGRQLLIRAELGSALVIVQSIADDTEYPESVRQAAAMAQTDINALLAAMADDYK